MAEWVMGSPATHDRLVRELAVDANAVLAFVDYDRSPENRYSVAIEEDYAATAYVAEHAADKGKGRSDCIRVTPAFRVGYGTGPGRHGGRGAP